MKKSNKTITINVLIVIIISINGCIIFFPNYFMECYSGRSSDLCDINFRAGEIHSISLENKIHTGAVGGDYPGTFSFDNDDVGSNPTGFNVREGAGYVNVIDAKGGHTKVVEMYDGVNNDHTELHNTFQLQTSGTVEFWILDEDVSDTFSIRLLDDTATSVWGDGIGWIQIWQDTLRYLDNIDWQVTPKVISDNTWYHIKIEFECTSGNYYGLTQDTWRFYVNGEVFGDYSFLNDINNITQIYFFQRGADMLYKCFVDAIGYSWDSNYDIGDNLSPIPQEIPNLIPIILISIGIGVAAFLGITLFLVIRKMSHRTRSTIISQDKSQLFEKVDSGSVQFKFCPLCGSQLNKTHKFCVKCGASLRNN